MDLNPLDAKNPPAFLIGALRKQLASGEKKNNEPAEPKKELTPEEIANMSDEAYDEWKVNERKKTNYSQPMNGGTKLLEEITKKLSKTID